MNKQESDILNALALEPFINQRILAETSGHSLGIVNRSIKDLIKNEYLDDDINLTSKAKEMMHKTAPQNAIILAAGFGMRMVPINMETPKALLEVNGERIIERLIKQLREVGIREIYVVVGFMKEQFEYLIDEYGVELIVNTEYASKNNLHSLKLAVEYISNSYIVPCDIWCDRNPFRKNELYSWYMVSDLIDETSDVRVNRKMELVTVPETQAGNTMIGISYILEEDAVRLREKIIELCNDENNNGEFWEKALYRSDGKRELMTVSARLAHSSDVVEINTYEQLRELDRDSMQLKSDAISVIKKVFQVSSEQITGIQVLKKGMTNRSFVFMCDGKKYIMRIPGEGTDQLINRREEAQVYQTLSGKGICDDPVYINPDNGYKITSFLDGIRCCDPVDVSDLKKCMARLRDFHEMKLKVDHKFDIFGQIEFYESLWGGKPSMYRDYTVTKSNVLKLKSYIDCHACEKVLTHVDAVPDNFLFYDRGNVEELQLTDWEYAGMQDPHVDIAMFCVYSMYNKRQVDRLISILF